MNRMEAKVRIVQSVRHLYDASECQAIAHQLLEHITGKPFSHNASEALSSEELAQLEAAQLQLAQGAPLQYVTNTAYFHHLKLYVDQRVLIPRPETEELVQWVIEDVKAAHPYLLHSSPATADQTKACKILDVGTGSGCIALSIKKAVPLAEVWGCDVSDDALTVARRNGAELDVRVDFQAVDFLDKAQQRTLPTVHVVVSNPPYIPLQQAANMHRNVKDWEPHQALFVPNEDALLFYKAFIQFGTHRLYEGSSIYAELHFDKASEVEQLFQEAGYDTTIKEDMQGVERMIRAVKRK